MFALKKRRDCAFVQRKGAAFSYLAAFVSVCVDGGDGG